MGWFGSGYDCGCGCGPPPPWPPDADCGFCPGNEGGPFRGGQVRVTVSGFPTVWLDQEWVVIGGIDHRKEFRMTDFSEVNGEHVISFDPDTCGPIGVQFYVEVTLTTKLYARAPGDAAWPALCGWDDLVSESTEIKQFSFSAGVNGYSFGEVGGGGLSFVNRINPFNYCDGGTQSVLESAGSYACDTQFTHSVVIAFESLP